MATPVHIEPDRIVLARAPTDSNIGSALSEQQSSASSILLTFVPVTLYALGFFFLFLVFRVVFPRVYSPRTYLSSLPQRERSPELPKGWFNWLLTFYKFSDKHVLNAYSLDGYLFLRHLKCSIIICVAGCVITWPILFPVNATGKGMETQLNILTWGNAAGPEDLQSYYRFYAHVLCAYLFIGFILIVITRESLFYINLRQAYLISPLYSERVSSRTVLFTCVPQQYLSLKALQRLLGPEKVKNVWIPQNTSDLEDKLGERDDVALKLENAEVELIRKANAARLKAMKTAGTDETTEIQLQEKNRALATASDFVAEKDRPTHRLKFLIGKKVDTINWARTELQRLIPEVEKLQEKARRTEGKKRNSAFVEFHTLGQAQDAFQSLTHHQPLHMAPRYTGIHPEEIIWFNMRIFWWERIIRIIISYSAVIATIIFWSFPVAFIGLISQITYLAHLKGLHWLSFINNLPKWLSGVVTGLLPSIMISVLMAVLPVYLRLMAKLSGEATLSGVEYTVQRTYFWFYVIQVFLVTTFSSGATQAVEQIIKAPATSVTLLAHSLPSASNFYLSYITLQGLAVVSQILLAVASLVLFLAMGKFLDKTPRKQFQRWISLAGPGLGTVYPIYTCMTVIAISYCCIAPLVTGFAALGLALFYLAYRYEFFYVYGVDFDTKGLMYARALRQLFTGLYLAELCMIGLLAIDLGNTSAVLGPLVLMIILLIFTALYQLALTTAIGPLLQYLPKTLETEEQRLLAAEGNAEDLEAPLQGRDAASRGESMERFSRDKSPISPTDSTYPLKKSMSRAEPNAVQKFLRPDMYTDYYKLRQLVPRDVDLGYGEILERDAYHHPSVNAKAPVIWIPRDPVGISKGEIKDTPSVIRITDEGAILNEKNRVVWDAGHADQAPIYEPKVYY